MEFRKPWKERLSIFFFYSFVPLFLPLFLFLRFIENFYLTFEIFSIF